MMQVDLSGGYYDAGDNVKYGLPMAFTVTTLSWAAIFHKHELQEAKEMDNVREAIKWGTDYFLKCSSKKGMLYVQVIHRIEASFNIFILLLLLLLLQYN